MTRTNTTLATVLASLTPATAAPAAPLPAPVAAMIDAAASNAEQLKAVVEVARKTNPGSATEIDAQVAGLEKQAAAARTAKLASQTFVQGWTGQAELGVNLTSGNSRTEGAAAALALNKETRNWRHKLTAAADVQRDNHVTSKERYAALYEANYKFSPRAYALGVAGFESDRFAGYHARFSEGVGIGYRIVDRPSLKLEVEAGPALRQTRYSRGEDEYALAGRGAANLRWQIAPDTVLTEAASAYVSGPDTTLSSTTALTARLLGPLSARASFSVIDETDPPTGRKQTDTTSRATLVYSF